ncbi:MAG: UDP-N-acetylmuramoyl-L-alanine--D-glutamate ligase [Gammaproteobacteria bacterium]|nr:UDP-N-acetylmuramoyl-L-alanine--D-glutamate ligase [Gammaproteobacteria bacterium]
MNDLRDKSVLVLGLGETGLSLARYLKQQGAKLRLADSRDAPPNLALLQQEMPKADIRCGVFRSELLDGIELLAISPGVPMAEPLVQKALSQRIPVAGDIELFAQALPQQDRPKVIAITGANGKTTVTSMVGAMCRAAGLDTEVAGNISPAVLDVLVQRKGRQPQVWVLELSSFQLETTHSLSADVATVLNISEDHLDRYEDMAAYIAAKARIFRCDGSGCTQVLNRDDAESMQMALKERSVVSFGLNPPPLALDWGVEREGGETWLVQGSQRAMRTDELQVSGLHNVANALAALALCRALGIPLAPLTKALREFKGLPHRVEKVAEFEGVIWYDDSKGTNVGATCAALSGLGRQSVVILGGDGKGQDFSPLKEAVAQHARAVVLIGRDAPLIEQAIAGCGRPVLHASDMAEAVSICFASAEPGDAVLMSPACASFDMYRNYLHRAEVFIAAVKEKEATCSARH